MRTKTAVKRRFSGPGGIPLIVAYLRVSSETQVEEGYSLEMQEELVREWCDREFGPGNYLLIIERDEGLSGSLGWEATEHNPRKIRPGLASAAGRLERGEVDFFVVYRTDRAFRNHHEYINFRARFFGPGASSAFVSLTECYDLTTKEGRLHANFLSLFAEYQREQLGEIVRDSHAKRRKEGYPTGGLGYGWRRTPRMNGCRPGLEVHPEQAPWVRRVYELYRLGWGGREIARELERQAAPPPTKSGRWTGHNVLSILRNPLHAGYIRDGDTVRPGVHWDQRLVEPDEHLEVLRLMRQRQRESSQPENREVQPLYRLGRCGTCGGLLTTIEDVTGLAYRCRGSADRGDVLPPADTDAGSASALSAAAATRGEEASEGPEDRQRPWGRAWCRGWHKSAELVNRELLRSLAEAVQAPQFLQLAEDAARAIVLQEGRQSLLEKRELSVRALKGLQERREKLTRAYIGGFVPEEDFQKLARELNDSVTTTEEELRELERRLANQVGEEKLLATIREKLPQLPEIWEVLLPEERRQLVRELTEYTVVERVSAGHAVLRVKIHYLPQQERHLSHGKSREAGFKEGVEGLSARELAYLCLLSEGHSVPEIRRRWNSNSGHLYNLRRSLLRRLNVDTVDEALELARERIARERPSLPLDVPADPDRSNWRPTQAQRVREVLERYARGLDRTTICQELGLKPQTVRIAEWSARKLYDVARLEEAIECFRQGKPPTGG
jgi:DNA invertase Pin-like site-specific DNA recombinase